MQEQTPTTHLRYTVAQITELARLITEVPSRYRHLVDAAIEVLNQGTPIAETQAETQPEAEPTA